MQTHTTLNELIKLLKQVSQEDTPITPDQHLMHDLELDSVKVMELMMILEDHFDISIPLNILPNVNTVADLANEITLLQQHTHQ